MHNRTIPRRYARTWLAAGILLLAAGFRIVNLNGAPPGLTHDEAGHGHDAAAVLRGVTPLYFTVGYGREPLFDYLNAGFFSLVGVGRFQLRLATALWGVVAVALTYAFARAAFGRRTAALAAALMAVSFWPVATGRQALRSGLLPVLTTVGALAFVRVLVPTRRRSAWPVLAFAIGASLYTYIPARVLWLVFPATLALLALADRNAIRRAWRPVLGAVLLGGALSAPLFLYLAANPRAEQRLEMLDEPLEALRSGDLRPVARNAGQTLLGLVVPGHGDDFLAYNIPGRPMVGWLTGAFLIAGLVACAAGWRRPAPALCLAWFGIGLAPSLVTGPAAFTTRGIGAQPVLFVIAAVGAAAVGRRARAWIDASQITHGVSLERAGAALTVLWIVATAAVSTRDYFVRWANDPEVRGAYHATLLQGLDTLSAIAAPRTTLISSPLPGVAHDPYIGELSPAAPTHDLRFANTSNALLLPSVDSALLYTSETVPAHPALDVAVMQSTEFHTRPDDLDSKYVIATFAPRDAAMMFTARVAAPDNDTVFGHAVRLEGAAWLRETYHAGETAELLTVWRVVDSAGVGPPVPPAGRSDVVLFTHVLDAEGALVAQRDELGAPSWQWQTGDTIVQIHALPLPAAMDAATYRTVVGIYDRLSGVRLATESGADIAEVLPLRVVSP